jgi:hypothetical protein
MATELSAAGNFQRPRASSQASKVISGSCRHWPVDWADSALGFLSRQQQQGEPAAAARRRSRGGLALSAVVSRVSLCRRRRWRRSTQGAEGGPTMPDYSLRLTGQPLASPLLCTVSADGAWIPPLESGLLCVAVDTCS